MDSHAAHRVSRRGFVGGLGLAGAAGLLGMRAEAAAAEPPPETTTIRLGGSRTLCFAPQYLAEELLRAEGFTAIQYVQSEPSAEAMARGELDLSFGLGGNFILRVDAGRPLVILAGGHVGCFELFVTRHVRSVKDLKGKAVAIPSPGSGPHVFLSVMLAYVGLDPRKDVRWVPGPFSETMGLLERGEVDAFLGFPPEPQELRARGIGRLLVNTAMDRPWSQYYCCMIAGNTDFVRRNPVATRRALRALLKAADLCAVEPERAADSLLSRGFAQRREYAVATLKDLPWLKWRDYSPEDTVRFFALKLQEIGMIQSTPQQIIQRGTDWRFVTGLRRELKG
jgi:NitT/TauT family transport system substrate-binding protein